MKQAFFIGILILGLAEFSYGFWIPAKAWLSQVLLKQAWQQSKLDNGQHKPWPWADTWPVFRLVHEQTRQSLLVLQGDSGQALAFGPGYHDQSYPPGQPGNTIISAHRDTHFDFLDKIGVGDQIMLEDTRASRHRYQVVSLDIADSRKSRIAIGTNEDLLTLVTCFPFHQIVPGGPLRYVVTAARLAS
jgi:sortase A